MHGQSSGFTMIMGGVDRSAEFGRDDRADRRLTDALLIVIAALMGTTAWLASMVLTRQVEAAVPVADTAPHYAYLWPADLNAPPSPESYVHPY